MLWSCAGPVHSAPPTGQFVPHVSMSAVLASLPAAAPHALLLAPAPTAAEGAAAGGAGRLFFHPFFPLLHLMHLPHLFLHRPFGGLGHHHGLGHFGHFGHFPFRSAGGNDTRGVPLGAVPAAPAAPLSHPYPFTSYITPTGQVVPAQLRPVLTYRQYPYQYSYQHPYQHPYQYPYPASWPSRSASPPAAQRELSLIASHSGTFVGPTLTPGNQVIQFSAPAALGGSRPPTSLPWAPAPATPNLVICDCPDQQQGQKPPTPTTTSGPSLSPSPGGPATVEANRASRPRPSPPDPSSSEENTVSDSRVLSLEQDQLDEETAIAPSLPASSPRSVTERPPTLQTDQVSRPRPSTPESHPLSSSVGDGISDSLRGQEQDEGDEGLVTPPTEDSSVTAYPVVPPPTVQTDQVSRPRPDSHPDELAGPEPLPSSTDKEGVTELDSQAL